jgi:ribosomal-protein-alanine N-acetyltransferase
MQETTQAFAPLAAQAVHIRPPELEDARSLLAFELANRAHFEAWVQPREEGFYSLEGVQAAIAAAQAARLGDRAFQYLVFAQQRLVGRVNLHAVRRAHHDCAELGYRIAHGEGGRGLASAAVALCLAEAFGPLDLWRVEATARPENAASIRVLERSGFQRFGHSRRSVRLQGAWFDLLHFERHRDAPA